MSFLHNIDPLNGKGEDSSKVRSKQQAVLYYLVAMYIGYMAFKILSSRLSGDDTMSLPVAILFTVLLGGGAVFIILYATHKLRIESKQSIEKTPEEKH